MNSEISQVPETLDYLVQFGFDFSETNWLEKRFPGLTINGYAEIQMSTPWNLGTILCLFAGIYHALMGGFSLLSPTLTQKAVGKLYAVQYQDGIPPALEFLWKPLGAFAITLSLFCFRAAFADDPATLKFCLFSLGALFGMRAAIRVFHRKLLMKAHRVSTKRNFANASFNLALMILAWSIAFGR